MRDRRCSWKRIGGKGRNSQSEGEKGKQTRYFIKTLHCTISSTLRFPKLGRPSVCHSEIVRYQVLWQAHTKIWKVFKFPPKPQKLSVKSQGHSWRLHVSDKLIFSTERGQAQTSSLSAQSWSRQQPRALFHGCYLPAKWCVPFPNSKADGSAQRHTSMSKNAHSREKDALKRVLAYLLVS